MKKNEKSRRKKASSRKPRRRPPLQAGPSLKMSTGHFLTACPIGLPAYRINGLWQKGAAYWRLRAGLTMPMVFRIKTMITSFRNSSM
jgi:hypothetical protein